ncbi:hypothetical protein CSKR_109076 [Clonorchis sinensis]|uniref:Uncharacterized protein n=1 Tax=Clonorchis sinensis TaxID=79923 RepID=A0A3R7FFZ2_CLOSI|nr:hypothetical protein CSKR_109076 [Clonorchis sinensis]
MNNHCNIVASFWCPAATPPQGSTMDGILLGYPRLDRSSRDADVKFEPRTFQSMSSHLNHLDTSTTVLHSGRQAAYQDFLTIGRTAVYRNVCRQQIDIVYRHGSNAKSNINVDNDVSVPYNHKIHLIIFKALEGKDKEWMREGPSMSNILRCLNQTIWKETDSTNQTDMDQPSFIAISPATRTLGHRDPILEGVQHQQPNFSWSLSHHSANSYAYGSEASVLNTDVMLSTMRMKSYAVHLVVRASLKKARRTLVSSLRLQRITQMPIGEHTVDTTAVQVNSMVCRSYSWTFNGRNPGVTCCFYKSLTLDSITNGQDGSSTNLLTERSTVRTRPPPLDLPLSRLGQPGSIPALGLPSGGLAGRHRNGVTAE